MQSDIYKCLAAGFSSHVKKRTTASDFKDRQASPGFVLNCRAIDRITQLVSDAKSEGATAEIGGGRSKDVPANFYPATILTGMIPDMAASHTEMFGPLAKESVFEPAQDVIVQINHSECGYHKLTICHSPGVWPRLLKISWLVKATKLLCC